MKHYPFERMGKEFTCLQCGKCCKDSREENYKSKDAEFIRDFLINVNHISLGLFDWEVDEFRKINDSLDTEMLDVRIANVVFNIKDNISIITHYTYNRNPKCAFLTKDNTCSIYHNRPIICRMWPCPYGKFQPKQARSSSKICKAELPLNELNKELDIKRLDNSRQHISEKLKQKLIIRYKECFYFRCLFDEINEMIMTFIEEQIKQGKIKPAKTGYNTDFLLKRIRNNPKVDFSDYYFKETGLRFDDFVKQAYNEKNMTKALEKTIPMKSTKSIVVTY